MTHRHDADLPQKQPAQRESIPGPVYDNPNEDETYVPPDTDTGDPAHPGEYGDQASGR